MEQSTITTPPGQPVAGLMRPTLTKAHMRRLRKLWSYGRPVHVGELSGVDLDLTVHGFVGVVANGLAASAVLQVTQLGIAQLNAVRQATVASQRPHHSLGQRLAQHLQNKGFHTWENVAFGNPDWSAPRLWGTVRPDVFACLPTLRAKHAASAIYEVKATRADFLADLAKPQKRMAYAVLAEAVYYCCQDGLIDKSDVPEGCGMVCEVEPGRFELRKKAKRTKGFSLATDTAMTLMVKRQTPLSVSVRRTHLASDTVPRVDGSGAAARRCA